MIICLRVLFAVVLASMVAVTTWAGFHCPLFAVPRDVCTHPWFIATLADAYWGFITFFVWVCCKQTAGGARLAWLVAILLLGNMAMSIYCLRELCRVPREASLADVLTTRRPGFDLLGIVLAVGGLAVTLLGLKSTM